MKEIVVGDVVVLNSGGPLMTVKDIYGENALAAPSNWTAAVTVAWIAADGRTMEHAFPLVCVRFPRAEEMKGQA